VASAKRQQDPATCGNCNGIRFRGVQLLELKHGQCERYLSTGKTGVDVSDPGCTYWSKRTKARVNADLADQANNVTLANELNRAVKNSRRTHS